MLGGFIGFPVLVAIAPALFVVLWSTGFIGAKMGLAYADPFVMLAVRFAMASVLLALIAYALSERSRLTTKGAIQSAVAGLLVHGFYLGGVFSAIEAGLSAGLTALIVGLQPALTAALAWPLFNEKLGPSAFLGCLLGIAGVAMVVADGVGWSIDALTGGGLFGYIAALCGLVSMALGFLYQKRIGDSIDPWIGQFFQCMAASALFAVAAFALDKLHIEWTGEFVFALLWLTIVVTIGAIGLLYALIKMGAAAKTASLFFLTPPTTAVMAFFLFDERLGLGGVAGFAFAAAGVFIVRRSVRPKEEDVSVTG